MSTHLYFDKQFIKISSDQYIALFLSGDDNDWYETLGKGAYGRYKSWGVFNVRGKVTHTLDEIIDCFKNDLSVDGTVSCSELYSSKSSDVKSFIRFIKNGAKHAVTIDQLNKLSTDGVSNANNGCIKLASNDDPISIGHLTSASLKSMLANDTIESVKMYWYEKTAVHIRRALKPLRKKVSKFVNETWVIKAPNGSYMKKLTSKNIHLARTEQSARHFISIKDAEAAVKKYESKLSSKYHPLTVEKSTAGGTITVNEEVSELSHSQYAMLFDWASYARDPDPKTYHVPYIVGSTKYSASLQLIKIDTPSYNQQVIATFKFDKSDTSQAIREYNITLKKYGSFISDIEKDIFKLTYAIVEREKKMYH